MTNPRQPETAPWAGTPQERFEHALRSIPDGSVRPHDGFVYLFIRPSVGFRNSTVMHVADGHAPWFDTRDIPATLDTLGKEFFLSRLSEEGPVEAAMVTTYDRTSDTFHHTLYTGAQAEHWFFTPVTIRDLVNEARTV